MSFQRQIFFCVMFSSVQNRLLHRCAQRRRCRPRHLITTADRLVVTLSGSRLPTFHRCPVADLAATVWLGSDLLPLRLTYLEREIVASTSLRNGCDIEANHLFLATHASFWPFHRQNQLNDHFQSRQRSDSCHAFFSAFVLLYARDERRSQTRQHSRESRSRPAIYRTVVRRNRANVRLDDIFRSSRTTLDTYHSCYRFSNCYGYWLESSSLTAVKNSSYCYAVFINDRLVSLRIDSQ